MGAKAADIVGASRSEKRQVVQGGGADAECVVLAHQSLCTPLRSDIDRVGLSGYIHVELEAVRCAARVRYGRALFT